MQKEVILTGLTTTPSDHESTDGEIAAMMNLVNENGKLVPIHQPKPLAKLPEDCEVYIHKTSDQHTNYILQYDGHYYWVDEDDLPECYGKRGFDKTKVTEIESLAGIENNGITAIANFLVIAGEDKMYYEVWKNDTYQTLSTDINYSVTVKHDGIGREYKEYISADKFIEYDDGTWKFIDGVKIRDVYSAYDAYTVGNMDDDELRGWMYGFVALKMYDGSYISLSDLFMIAPPKLSQTYGFLRVKGDNFYIDLGSIYKANINVDIDSGYNNDLIISADVFLTTYDHLLNLNNLPNSFFNSPFIGAGWRIHFANMNDSEFRNTLESMSFYRIASIPKEDFGKDKPLKRADVTNVSYTYTDLARTDIICQSIYQYNKRLHAVGAKSISRMSPQIKYRYANDNGRYYGFNVELTKAEPDLKDVTLIAEKQSSTRHFRLEQEVKLQYPLPPIVSIPTPDITNCVIKVDDKARYTKMHTHPQNAVSLCYTDGLDYKFSFEDWGFTEYDKIPISLFTNDKFEYYSQSKVNELISPSLPEGTVDSNKEDYTVKVSEVANPFVFPSENTVTVGNGKIIGMASVTQALSQGQFGQYPLYVFTTEGVWALQLNQSGELGTYSKSSPVSRDVCINANSICQTDSGVLFATDRGIMMLSGSQVVCITKILEDGVQKIRMPKLGKAMKICGIEIGSDELSDYVYEKDLHTLLKKCRMMYDYKCQRVVVYDEDSSFALVFSLESSTWGMMDCKFVRTLNSYPECLAVTTDDKDWMVVDMCDNKDQEIKSQYVITRPLKLDAPDLLKRIDSMIVRGNFRKGNVKIVLFGSRDLFSWFPIWSSVDHYLRGFSGTPYKYYRVLLLSTLKPDESISGLTVDFTGSLMNKLR